MYPCGRGLQGQVLLSHPIPRWSRVGAAGLPRFSLGDGCQGAGGPALHGRIPRSQLDGMRRAAPLPPALVAYNHSFCTWAVIVATACVGRAGTRTTPLIRPFRGAWPGSGGASVFDFIIRGGAGHGQGRTRRPFRPRFPLVCRLVPGVFPQGSLPDAQRCR